MNDRAQVEVPVSSPIVEFFCVIFQLRCYAQFIALEIAEVKEDPADR
jgi:hypothetical protein